MNEFRRFNRLTFAMRQDFKIIIKDFRKFKENYVF